MDEILPPNRAAALAEYHRTLKGEHPPWGSLTGIRPTKLVRQWLAMGMTDDEIVAVLQDPYCVSPQKAALALRVGKAEQAIAEKIAGTVSFYVSIPFCPSRCAYCSFTSGTAMPEGYVAALCKEIQTKFSILNPPFSIYIGGGTPTVLSEAEIEAVLACMPPTSEFTVEAGRPDTITPAKLRIMRRHGVNRIAINPQTLNDATLARIGRSHTAADFTRAFHMARDAGFDCINCDIIAGLPGENADDMHRNFEVLEQLTPENITVHTLAVKRNSFFVGCAHTPDRESAEGVVGYDSKPLMEQLGIAADGCDRMGLMPYYLYRGKSENGKPSPAENIGYAIPGKECAYNVAMMAEITPITGCGAAACTKIFKENKIFRVFNPKNPEIYVQRLKS